MKVETNRTLQYKFLQWHPIYTCTHLYLIVYGLGEQLAPSTAWWGVGEVIPVTLFVHRVFCRKSPMKCSAYCYCFYPPPDKLNKGVPFWCCCWGWRVMLVEDPQAASWGLPFQDIHVWFGLSSPFTKFHSVSFVLTSVTFPITLKLIEPYYNAFGSAKNLPATEETWVQFLSQEDPLKKEMATHSSILTWRIP